MVKFVLITSPPHKVATLCDDFAAVLWSGVRRASKSWGSSRQGLFFQRHIRIPALEHRSERLLQGVHPRVPQAMGAARGPLPRRLFADAPAADLGDRGFDTTRAHPLTIARARAVGGDDGALPLAIRVELLYRPQECPARAIAGGGDRHVAVQLMDGELRVLLIYVAMP